MSSELPLVTVVTPSLNQRQFIGQTIESVRSQDYPRIEHVVVDGGSTDGTVELLEAQSGIRWISEPDRGQADAINKGFRLATGEIFAWLNADDVYLPGAVSAAVAELQATGAGLVYGGHSELDEHGRSVHEYPARAFDRDVLLNVKNFISQPAAFFTRAAFEAVGGLDSGYEYALDYDLWVRIARDLDVRPVGRILAGFRLHPESKTSRHPEAFFPEVHRASRKAGGRYFSRMYVNQLPVRHPRLFRLVILGRRIRELWFRAHRRLGRPIRIRVDDSVLVLDPRDELAGLLFLAEYEPAEREFVRRALRPGDTFADVGAHVGLFSVLAARRVRPSGRVFSFEPSARSYAGLQRNLRRNGVDGVAVARRAALSDADGTATIHVGDERYGAWTSFGRTPPGASVGEEEVETRTVDSLVRDGELERPFLVKLDVEGWELHVVNGGSETFSRDDAPHLLVEFTDIAAEAAGSSTQALYAALVAHGYSFFRYVGGELVDEPCRDAYPYDNLVASKRVEELRARLRQ